MITEAVILAGGKGTRLRPAVPELPKFLAPINGRPFAHILLGQLEAVGVQRVVLATGVGHQQIIDALGPSFGPIELCYSRETTPLGTGGAMRLALGHCNEDPVLVVNGDTYAEIPYRDLLEYHRHRRATITVALSEVNDTCRYGRVRTDEGGTVRDFKRGTPGPGWINAGAYLVSPERLDLSTMPERFSLEDDLFPTLTDGPLHGYPCSGAFIDIGTPDSFAAAQDAFAGGAAHA